MSDTIRLPVRLGRFLARKLDPRRRESLEDSLRIRERRWEERRDHFLDLAARHHDRAGGVEPAPTVEPAAAADEAKADGGNSRRGRRMVDWLTGSLDMIDLGDLAYRGLSLVARGVVSALEGLLDGLTSLDV